MSLSKRRQLTPVMKTSKRVQVEAESFFLQEAHCGSDSLIKLQLIQPQLENVTKTSLGRELYVSFHIVLLQSSINT